MKEKNQINLSLEEIVRDSEPSDERYEEILENIFEKTDSKSYNPAIVFLSKLKIAMSRLPMKDTVEVAIFIAILIIIPLTFSSIKRGQNINPVHLEKNISGESKTGDSKNENKTNDVSDIKTSGIYSLSIIGSAPKTLVLKPFDNTGIRVNVCTISSSGDGYSAIGHFYYDTEQVSGFGLGGNTAIVDRRMVQNFNGNDYPAKIDVNKLVLIYYKYTGPEEAPQLVAYSKLVDMKHRANNIQNIRFQGMAENSDILVDAVAVVKENGKYKLIGSTTYNVVGDIPKEMRDAVVELPDGKTTPVDINKVFVVYLSSLKLSRNDNGGPVCNVEVLTYSPLTGGNPVNMNEQERD